MELAKNLAQWRDQSPDQWMAQANRVLPPIIVAGLVVLIAVQAADLTWRLLESPARQAAVPPPLPVNPGGGDRNLGNLTALETWRPFGEPPAANPEAIPAETILEGPDTSLPLKLHSALQVQDLPERDSMVIPEAGAAIIASSSGGAQKMYRTGDTIDNASGAVLHSVYSDRVALDRGGRIEILRFPPLEGLQNSAARLNSRVQTTPLSARPAADPAPASQASIFDSMNNITQTLAQHMTIAAHTENGQTIGYRLQPRGDSQVFSELGLEPGDVLTEVNGIRPDGVSNTMQILRALGETPQASVTIRRNGVDQAMVLDMSQLERLTQSLQ